MSKPKAPKSPDYKGAAVTQGHINNPTVNTVGGSQTVTWKGNDPTVTQTLSPEQQKLYDQRVAMQQGLGMLGLGNLDFMKDFYSQGFNDDGSLDRQNVEDSLYNRATSRLDPEFNTQEDQLRTRLANQGITEGSEAYTNSMRDFNFAKNDAYSNARNTAISGADASQRNYLANALMMRNQPLSEQANLMSMSQGQMPQFQNYSPTDYMGAVNAQGNYNADMYNAKSAQQGNLMNGLFGLGQMGLMYFSDRRLKTDIEKVGETDEGLGKYIYRYIWDRPDTKRLGVMADEVEKIYPHAVQELDGYKLVNYGLIKW